MKTHNAFWTAVWSVLLLGSVASAQNPYGSFALIGGEEVPPNASANTGTAKILLNLSTNTLSWNIEYTGFTATAAHFHGPAAEGVNAGIKVPIGTANPAIGSVAVSAQDAADIQANLWYVNIHSAAFPGGELRGQVILAWEDLGGSTTGVNGKPGLLGGGALKDGSTASLRLRQGPPAAPVLAWLSFNPTPIPFDGGTVHTLPFTQQFAFSTNGVGDVNVAANWPPGIPAGIQAYLQFICADVTVPSGLTLSNAVRMTSQ